MSWKKLFGALVLFVAALSLAYSVPSRVFAPVIGLFEEAPVRVLFVGDIMLDRNVALTINQEGASALFASTSAFLADSDVRVGNLEGTITTNPSIAQRNNHILHFTFDPAQARAVLAPLHFDALSLANNHALDFGEFGYDDTRHYLTDPAGGINAQPFGQPYNDAGRLSTVVTVKAKQLCFVGYHSLYVSTTTSVVDEITRLRPDCWKVVVFAHWGIEYQTHSTAAQQEEAHTFIDAGADLVIGAHPHVVEEREVYKGKAIFYSLGNFMFDQNFSPEVTRGLAVRADFYTDKTTFILTPVTIVEQHSALATGAQKEAILGRLGNLAEFSLP